MKRIKLRTTHPNMFRGAMTFGVVLIALGANFFLFKPTFNQYHLAKIMGGVFAVFGSVQVFALLTKNLPLLRGSMAAIVTSTTFWGGALTVFWAQTGKTSLQLPITYFGLALLQLALLVEPASNPDSQRGDDDGSG